MIVWVVGWGGLTCLRVAWATEAWCVGGYCSKVVQVGWEVEMCWLLVFWENKVGDADTARRCGRV